MQNMVYNTIQHLQRHTLSVYTVRLLWEGGGVGEVREKVEGQQLTRGVENTNMIDCISSQSINSIKHQ
jgi:hypothetical protein